MDPSGSPEKEDGGGDRAGILGGCRVSNHGVAVLVETIVLAGGDYLRPRRYGVDVLQGSDRCHGRWDEGSVKGYTTDWINDDCATTPEYSILVVWLEGVTRSSDGRMERPLAAVPDHAAARVGPVLGCGPARARSGSRWLSSASAVFFFFDME